MQQRSIGRVVLLGGILTCALRAEAQLPSSCRFPTNDVPVYFNPGTLGNYGYDPAPFREALFNALAVWRQQSMSMVNFYYAGDTTLTRIPNALVVEHDDTCNGRLASAFTQPGANCGLYGAEINIHMLGGTGCTPTAWNTHWSGPGSNNYEGILIHEVGHAVFGFADLAPQATSVMVGQRGQAAADLYLYSEDVLGAIGAYGLTTQQPQTLITPNLGGAWSSLSPFTIAGVNGSFPPSLAATANSAMPIAGSVTTYHQPYVEVRHGSHGSFFSYANAVPSAGNIWHQSASAVSNYGETMVVAPTQCNRSTFCRLRWAWTANNGSSWQSGTLLAPPTNGTFTAPVVAYDPAYDRFVVAYLAGDDSELYTLWTNAASANWSTPTLARSASAYARPFRHLGGLIFASNGSGLIAASAHWDEPPTIYYNSVITPITQSDIAWNANANVYDLGATNYVRWYGARSEARTRVPFGLARNNSSEIFMVWRGTSGARRLTFATKTSLQASTWFSVPTETNHEAANGVTVGPGPFADFTVGLAN
jgi:hypothetical protein